MNELKLEIETYDRLGEFSVKELMELEKYYTKAIRERKKRKESTNEKLVIKLYEDLDSQWRKNRKKVRYLLNRFKLGNKLF